MPADLSFPATRRGHRALLPSLIADKTDSSRSSHDFSGFPNVWELWNPKRAAGRHHGTLSRHPLWRAIPIGSGDSLSTFEHLSWSVVANCKLSSVSPTCRWIPPTPPRLPVSSVQAAPLRAASAALQGVAPPRHQAASPQLVVAQRNQTESCHPQPASVAHAHRHRVLTNASYMFLHLIGCGNRSKGSSGPRCHIRRGCLTRPFPTPSVANLWTLRHQRASRNSEASLAGSSCLSTRLSGRWGALQAKSKSM